MITRFQFHNIIAKLLRSKNRTKLTKVLEKRNLPEIVDLILNLMPAEQTALLEVLFEMKQAGKALVRLPKTLAQDLMTRFDDSKLVLVLKRLPERESRVLLRYVPEDRSNRILSLMGAEKSSQLTELLLHPEDSAGDLMTTSIMAFPENTTVKDILDYPRTMKKEVTSYNLYAVDDKGRLTGVIPLHELLLEEVDRKLADFMERDVIRVPLEASKEEIAHLINRYNLLSLPVVDHEGVLKGAVSIDSILEVLQDEATEDMYKIAGLDKEDRVFVKPLQSVRKRLPWLSINIITALAGATVVNFFQHTIDQMVALVIFMPVIAGLGGNTGAQTLTVIVRGIALGEVQLPAAWRIVSKELVVGLINGLFIGFLVAMVAIIWKGPIFLGVIVALAMMCNLVVASLIGTLVPLTLKYLGFDPAIASNILVTAATDFFGFFAYLGLATLFLDYMF